MMSTDPFTCNEVFRRLDDYLDRELSPGEMLLVRAHLETCAACASEHRFERGVLDRVKEKVRRLPVPSDLAAKIHAALSR